MINQFDFFYVQAHSHSIRALTKVGIPRTKIQTTIDWTRRFPQKNHTASIHYVDVMNIGHDEARKLAQQHITTLPNVEGVKYYLRFHPVD
jgi:beta-glucosidase/6-phospho-beta-glucosidase/beta-galactosidase